MKIDTNAISRLIKIYDRIDAGSFLDVFKNEMWKYAGVKGKPTYGDLAQAVENYLLGDKDEK